MDKTVDFNRSHPIDGVVPFWEQDVLLAAKVSQRLGLPGLDIQSARKARVELRSLGVEIKEFWFCQGRYDMVVSIEAPDIQTYAKALLKLGSYGNIHSQTLRALSEDEYREIIVETE